MNIESVLYLIDLLDNLDTLLDTIFWLSFLVFALTLLISGISYGTYGYEFKDSFLCRTLTCLRINAKWLILLLLISCFIPSEKTMYLMLGANYFKNSSLPPKVEAVIEKKLNEYLLESTKKDSK